MGILVYNIMAIWRKFNRRRQYGIREGAVITRQVLPAEIDLGFSFLGSQYLSQVPPTTPCSPQHQFHVAILHIVLLAVLKKKRT